MVFIYFLNSFDFIATISTTIQDSNHIVAVDTPEGVKIYVAHSGRTVSFGLYFYASLTAGMYFCIIFHL